jgi:L-ascorbate metabolism protein UlaG (beta-lactamase superfamily)
VTGEGDACAESVRNDSGAERWKTPDAPELVSARVTWLGHSTTVIEIGGVRILTDPVIRTRVAHLRRASEIPASALSQVDLVLVSHVHWDHLDLASLGQIERSTPVVVPSGAGVLLSRRGFRNVVEVEAGDAVGVRDISLRATHAEHTATRGPFGVRAPSLGYLVERPRKIYFAGDTDLFDGMSEFSERLEVALLPISGWGPRVPPGHLDPERAARALQLLRPRIAIPIHWGTYWPMHSLRAPGRPADEFVRQAALLSPDVEIRVLAVGGSCVI